MPGPGSTTEGWRGVFKLLGPGLAACAVAAAWGLSVSPPRRADAALAVNWYEPKMPADVFSSFRPVADYVVAETQPFAPQHPRAHSYLLPRAQPQVPFAVRVEAKFERGRTVGVDFAKSASFDSGFRLSTGLDVGADAGRATVRRLEANVDVPPLIGTPLEMKAGNIYKIAFRRDAEFVRLEVDGKEVLRYYLGSETVAAVRFFVQGSKVELRNLHIAE